MPNIVFILCVTQLLHVMEHWTKILDNGNDVDIIYLDFCKAFDHVPYQCLLSKLKAYGISGSMYVELGHEVSIK